MNNFSPPPPAPQWATFIPSRTTKAKFVIHKTEGYAKAAITQACQQRSRGDLSAMELLRWVDNEWVSVYSIPAGTLDKELPWRKK